MSQTTSDASTSTSSAPEAAAAAAPTSAEINATIRYTMWSVFRAAGRMPEDERPAAARELEELLAADEDVVVRGLYDVSGLRADADVMVWWHASSVEALQGAYHRLRRSAVGRVLEPVWSSTGLHRPAEFNKGHVPAFMAGEEARGYLCVYPFVRSYDWYLLEDADRKKMLRDHGMAAMPYPDVRANTVSAFALGDYEWLLAFEADELHRIVDLMRELRATEARRHVREELPFYTGPRVSPAEVVERLP
nr:hydrogen peroxide-dependent heme synthase [uncultured Pseudokineococcus sp.]